MPKTNAEAIRPGSIFRAWDTSWRVKANDTLNRTMDLESPETGEHKRIRYQPGQEIFLRWSPANRI